MKTWTKRSLIGLLGAGLLGGGIAAFADRGPCGWHGHHGWQTMGGPQAAGFKAEMIERVGSHLDVDPAQKALLALLADRIREQQAALVGSGADPRAELTALVAGPAFDRAGAEALLLAKTEAIRAQGPRVIAAAADFFDSLRPEQQAQLREFTNRHRHGRS